MTPSNVEQLPSFELKQRFTGMCRITNQAKGNAKTTTVRCYQCLGFLVGKSKLINAKQKVVTMISGLLPRKAVKHKIFVSFQILIALTYV